VKTFLYVGAIAVVLLAVVNDRPAQKRTSNKSPSTRARADWHTSWDQYLKTVQNCLNEDRKKRDSCTLSRFKGQSVEWEGIFKGLRSTEKAGEVVDIEMTPGSMTDPAGKTSRVANTLVISPSDAAAWRNLTVGQKVRFRARTSTGILGAGFFPTNEPGCCFIVDFDGKAALLEVVRTKE
jgi:hypothetical protein